LSLVVGEVFGTNATHHCFQALKESALFVYA
jgi:hypothetical protein